MSQQRSPSLPKTAAMSNEFVEKYSPFDNVECFFDIVAVFGNVAAFGNSVAGLGNIVERNFVLSTKPKQIEHEMNE